MKVITTANYMDILQNARQPWHGHYYAFYSSLLGGITLEPLLMQVPIDDHLVHRGDGVFDTFKCVNNAAYNLDAHLQRLMGSAEAIGLVWSAGIKDIRSLTLATLKQAGQADCTGRVMLARGPGGFGVSPYESPAPALYIIVYGSGRVFLETHPEGGRAMRSQVPAKPAHFARVKNCNYLTNVLMRREAEDAGVDFVIGFNEHGVMTEGATENFGIVTPDKRLVFPELDGVLAGTTMLRVMTLAETLVAAGTLRSIEFGNITEAELLQAAEIFAAGTTINVAPVCHYNGKTVGSGKPGPVALELNRLLHYDITCEPSMRTSY